MDSYILAEVRDAPDAQLSRPDELPFPVDLTRPEGMLLFVMRKNTKLGGMVARLEKEFKKAEVRRALFHGVGECCVKCVSCVEIVKNNWSRDLPPLHQWNVTRVSKSVDVWAPEREEDKEKLDRIIVEKNVPQLFILLSKDPFSDEHICGRLIQPAVLKRARPVVSESCLLRSQYLKASIGVWKRPSLGEKTTKRRTKSMETA